jgi:hypothetical protein
MPFLSRASIEALAESHQEMAHQMEKVALVLAVSDPKASVSAESYQGLRKTVMAAANERRAHLAQLAQACDAIDRGVSATDLRTLMTEWCEQAGLAATSDTEDPGLFRVVAGDGDVLEVVSPAWVDTTSGALVRQGQARLTTSTPAVELAESTSPVQVAPDMSSNGERPGASPADGEEPGVAAIAEATELEGEEA